MLRKAQVGHMPVLLPPLLRSTVDPSPEVAAAATAALEASFPPGKLTEVRITASSILMFVVSSVLSLLRNHAVEATLPSCSNSILMFACMLDMQALLYFSSDLLHETMTTLGLSKDDVSEPKLFTIEESTERHLRLQLTAVLSLHKLLSVIVRELSTSHKDAAVKSLSAFAHEASDETTALETVWAHVLPPCCMPAATASHAPIRRAIYELSAFFVTNAPAAVAIEHFPALGSALPHFFEEHSTDNMDSMWTALLQILRYVRVVCAVRMTQG